MIFLFIIVIFCFAACDPGYPHCQKIAVFSEDTTSFKFHIDKGSRLNFVISNSENDLLDFNGILEITKSGNVIYRKILDSKNLTECNWIKGRRAFIVDREQDSSGKVIWPLDELILKGEEYEIQCMISYSTKKPERTELWIHYFIHSRLHRSLEPP